MSHGCHLFVIYMAIVLKDMRDCFFLKGYIYDGISLSDFSPAYIEVILLKAGCAGSFKINCRSKVFLKYVSHLFAKNLKTCIQFY